MTQALPTIGELIEIAHRALRCVDASDTDAPQTEDTLDRVSEAVAAIEQFATVYGVPLSERMPTGAVLPNYDAFTLVRAISGAVTAHAA
jgi:hypothetical protein